MPRRAKRPSDFFVGRTLALDILDRLRRDLVACVLKPGTRLKFAKLQEVYVASFGTLREALVQLTAEGLVIAKGQRGYAVAPANLDDLWDLTRARVVIEREVILRSLEVAGEAWETRVLAAFQELSRIESRCDGVRRSADPRWSAAHAEFHEALASACDSPTLLELRRVLYTRAERYRRMSARYAPDVIDKAEEHRAIMEACISRDARLALLLVEQHIQHTAENVVAFVPGFVPIASSSRVPGVPASRVDARVEPA